MSGKYTGPASKIACPACHAPAGERCTTREGLSAAMSPIDAEFEMKVAHRVRTALAKKNAGQQLTRYEYIALHNYGLQLPELLKEAEPEPLLRDADEPPLDPAEDYDDETDEMYGD